MQKMTKEIKYMFQFYLDAGGESSRDLTFYPVSSFVLEAVTDDQLVFKLFAGVSFVSPLANSIHQEFSCCMGRLDVEGLKKACEKAFPSIPVIIIMN